MKKNISFLLSTLLIIAIIFSASTTFAMETDNFAQMTPQEQYEYLQTLESDEEIQQALDTLSKEQLVALEAYKQSLEQKKDKDTVDFADMTPEKQYEYLQTLESEDEINDTLKLLTKEQLEALKSYESSLTPEELEKPKEKETPAINYTKAGPLKPPVNIGSMSRAGLSAARALSTCEEEDALVISKTANGSYPDYTITIESYATGEVTITPGEPIPADIIMVLDTSGSMGDDIIDTETMKSKSFSKNKKAYDFEDNLYVKDSNQYWLVTITRAWSWDIWKYVYTYRYTANGVLITETSIGNSGSPPEWDFYKRVTTTTSRIAALKAAAKEFIDDVYDNANLDEGVDHRIAVATFASGSSIISGTGTSSGAFVDAHSNSSGIGSLKDTIDLLSPDGATRADLGMNRAVQIFENDPPDTSGQRNRVVIFFTDGTPTSYDTFDPAVANGAISHAKTLKKDPPQPGGYGATVYSIGIFDGADPTAPIDSASTSKENKFMHFVSSNYPNATNMSNPGSGGNEGYYLSASTSGALDDIFQNISDDIVTGGTTVTLDESSVIRDILTSYFELDTARDINIYTSEVDNATGVWQTPISLPGGTATVSADGKTISISGFDYAENYYAAIEEDGVITGYRGKKLIVEIPIRYIGGSCFGGTVPTNEPESGIYDDDTLVETLPIPKVDIPVDYDFNLVDKSIYLTQLLALSDLFAFDPSYIADGVNNKYVNIVYTLKDSGSADIGTYTILAGDTNGVWDLNLTGLNANTHFTISCTVTPVSGEVIAVTIEKNSNVYVFKPTVTYQDSVIYLGETANYTNNFVSQEWKNSVASAPLPSGTPPTLTYTYDPVEAAFDSDTHVNTMVKIGATDVTSHVTFNHENCSEPSCGFNPNLGQFIVHVKTCSLTITKTGATDSTDTFIFEVFGTMGDNNVTIIVSMQGNTSRTIVGLPAGEYTVTEKADWSWRYTAPSQSTTLGCSNSNAEVVINNNQTNNKWLSGDSWIANIFNGNCHGTEE